MNISTTSNPKSHWMTYLPKYYFYIFRDMSDAAFEKTLTLGDAIRLSGPMAFNIMIKPAGRSAIWTANIATTSTRPRSTAARSPG